MNQDEIQENQETNISNEENEIFSNESNIQSEQNSQSTELVEYQQHITTSLDNNNTLLICSYVFLGVVVGVMLSKTFWRRFNI